MSARRFFTVTPFTLFYKKTFLPALINFSCFVLSSWLKCYKHCLADYELYMTCLLVRPDGH